MFLLQEEIALLPCNGQGAVAAACYDCLPGPWLIVKTSLAHFVLYILWHNAHGALLTAIVSSAPASHPLLLCSETLVLSALHHRVESVRLLIAIAQCRIWCTCTYNSWCHESGVQLRALEPLALSVCNAGSIGLFHGMASAR